MSSTRDNDLLVRVLEVEQDPFLRLVMISTRKTDLLVRVLEVEKDPSLDLVLQ
jgi:hypothetical protein